MVWGHADAPINCGEDAKKHFSFSKGYTNLNHGSFGAIPDAIRSLQRSYQDQAESEPDVFLRYTLPPLLSANRQAIADYVSASKSDVVFVPNATTGVNTVLRNLVFEPGDVCIYFSTIYGALEKALYFLAETTPLQMHRIELAYPVPDADIVSFFEVAIRSIRAGGSRPKLAIFDTISSVPGLPFPYRQLTRLCCTERVLSLVDGAQGTGQIDLSLHDLDPDFFISNLHKWLFVPRPCAILYVARRNQHLIRSTLPTSHGFIPKNAADVNNPLPTTEQLSEFESNFEFTGTADITAYLCVQEALRWRRRVEWNNSQGEDAIRSYLRHSAEEAGRICSQRLGTRTMQGESSEPARCAFTNVELPMIPDEIFGTAHVEFSKVLKVARWVEKTIVERYNTFIVVYWHQHRFWTRLSGQIYLTAEDWNKAAMWLEAVCRAVSSRQWD